jgi:hypothetical protein
VVVNGVAYFLQFSFDPLYTEFKLANLGSCVVIVQHDFCDYSIDLWFLLDMVMDKGLWTKRCSTRYAASSCLREPNIFSPTEPLVLLEDGKIVRWVEEKRFLRVYDPRTRMWEDLAKLEHCYAANVYTGNLLCSGLQG